MADTHHSAMWRRCMEMFQRNVNEQQFATWLKPMRFKSYDEEKRELTVYIPSQFFYEYLEAQFRRLIHLTIDHVFGSGTQLFYEVEVARRATVKQESDDLPAEERKAPAARDASRSPRLEQAVGPAQDLDSQLNAKQNFGNFIEGDSNKLPRSVGQSIADRPDQQMFNPLFIYGPSGVGKTHLVNAIGTRLKERHPEKRVLYLSAHLFQVQYTDSVRRNTFNDFMHFYQSIDALIVDDVQELIGKVQTQYAFFHIFNHLRQNGRQIILTSDRPPVSLQGMEDRLLTRFKSGLLAELERPEPKLRKDILQSMIKHDGLDIPESVVEYISQNVSDSVRELEGVIHSLLAYSVVYGREVDLDFARRVMTRAARPREAREVTMDMIVESACERFSVRQEELYGASRKAGIVLARQAAMYLAQRLTPLTSKRIGMLVGNRNHATVLHGVKAIATRLKTDRDLSRSIEEMEAQLKGGE